MCGIAGSFGIADQHDPGAMLVSMKHRGPDGDGVFCDDDNHVILCHVRLAIIDTRSVGNQPMWDASGSVVIVFNGEIYNFRELRQKLDSTGYRFATNTDTEVLINLYQKYGLEALRQLNGMFAFALWDTKRRELVIARDAMGVKPLYYCEGRDSFTFASELKTLLKMGVNGAEVSTEALAQYLTYMYAPTPFTPLKGIHKLESGCALRIRDGRIVEKLRFVPDSKVIASTHMGEREACEGLTHHLSEAVRRQMVADVKVGSFLSGGLDSSALCVFAREEVEFGELDCFTIGIKTELPYSEGVVEDLPYARKVASHLGVKLHTLWVGSSNISEFRRMIYHLDEPQGDPAPINVGFICSAARRLGIKVLLSGAGGDDIFSGYRRHYAIQQERWWGWLPKSFRSVLRRSGGLVAHNSPFGRRWAKAFRYADESPDRRLAGYFSWLDSREIRKLFVPELQRELATIDPLAPMLDHLAGLPLKMHPLERMLSLEQKFFLTDHNLNYTDKMSMAEGVEVRVPFLDPDLMAFAASIPAGLKQRGSCGKWIFKKAMEPYLPHDVIYRSKTGFGAPLRMWMQNELKGYVDEMLSESTIKRRGLFDYAAVRGLVERDRRGQIDASYPIFQLICIETWCQIFLDQHGVL